MCQFVHFLCACVRLCDGVFLCVVVFLEHEPLTVEGRLLGHPAGENIETIRVYVRVYVRTRKGVYVYIRIKTG